MKVKISILGIALLLFSCIEPGQNEPPIINLDILAYGVVSGEEGQMWIDMKAAFELANPNVNVQYELLYDMDYHNRVDERLGSGNIPDLAYLAPGEFWSSKWANANQLYDHRSIIDETYFDINLIPAMGSNGEIYEIPIGTSTMCSVLFANESLLTQLGLTIPTSYADLVNMVPIANANGKRVISVAAGTDWVLGSCLLSTILPRLSADPEWIIKAVNGTASFTDQVFIDSLTFIQQMVADGILGTNPELINYLDDIEEFNNGNALFLLEGQWVTGGIDALIADDVAIIPFPSIPGQSAGTPDYVPSSVSFGIGITYNCATDIEKRDMAMEFIKLFNSDPFLAERIVRGGITSPIVKNYSLPASLPIISITLATTAVSVTSAEVIDTHLLQVPNNALNSGLQDIITGSSTPTQVAINVENLARQ